MTTAINEAFVGEGDFSGWGNGHFFGCWTGFFPHLQGFLQMVGLWGGGKGEQGQGSPYMAGAISKMKDDIFLVKWGYMGYNSGQ